MKYNEAVQQPFNFRKMHGLGNDFVILDGVWGSVTPFAKPAFDRDVLRDLDLLPVKEICHRKLGIGCDQLIVLVDSADADVEMIIFNQDGSRGKACGNAARCVAKMLGSREVTIAVAGRKLHARNEADGSVTVNMGHPEFDLREISSAHGRLDGMSLTFNYNAPYDRGYAVSMGNPHLIFFVPEVIDDTEISKIGSHFETHELFPERTNVGFVRLGDRENITMRVWERGVGITMACGSGACAAVAITYKLGVTDRRVSTHLLGGTLDIEISTEGVLMNGAVREVFKGIYVC